MAANYEGIRFNPATCSGPEKTLFLDIWETGEHSSDANWGLVAVIAHEMGHVIADSGRTSKGTRLDVLTSRAIVHKHVRDFRSEVGRDAVIKELSPYAWYGGWANPSETSESALNETWSHAFSAYYTNRKKLSPRTRRLVETVLRDLGMRWICYRVQLASIADTWIGIAIMRIAPFGVRPIQRGYRTSSNRVFTGI